MLWFPQKQSKSPQKQTRFPLTLFCSQFVHLSKSNTAECKLLDLYNLHDIVNMKSMFHWHWDLEIVLNIWKHVSFFTNIFLRHKHFYSSLSNILKEANFPKGFSFFNVVSWSIFHFNRWIARTDQNDKSEKLDDLFCWVICMPLHSTEVVLPFPALDNDEEWCIHCLLDLEWSFHSSG